jgi:hypothetical protein
MNLHIRRIAVAPVAWFSLLFGFFHGLVLLIAAAIFEHQINAGMATIAQELGIPVAPVNYGNIYMVIGLIALPIAYLVTGVAIASIFNLIGGFHLEKEDQDLLAVTQESGAIDGQPLNCAWCGAPNLVPTDRRLFHCHACGAGSIVNDDGNILKLG